MLETGTYDIARKLRPVSRRLALRHLERYTVRGLTCGAAAAVAVLVVSRLFTIPAPLQVSAALLAAATLGGVLAGVRSWPDAGLAARAADRHFALQDRITTALEFRSSPGTLPRLQRSDAAGHVEGLALRQSRTTGATGREWLLAGATAAVCLTLFLLGVPPGSRHTARGTADQVRIRHAAVYGVPAIVLNVNKGLPRQEQEDPALRQLALQLALLRHRLLASSSRAAALRSISLTQQQIHRIAATVRAVDPRSVARLNRALAAYAGSQGTNARPAGSTDPTTAARTLSRLAASLPGLTPSQRSQLVRSLGQAANKVVDPSLRSTLRQAASSLANDNAQMTKRSLEHAASFLSSAPAHQVARSKLAAANAQLQQLKGNVSGLRRPAPGPRPVAGRNASSRNQPTGQGTSFRGGNSRSAPGQAQVGGSGVGRFFARKNIGSEREVNVTGRSSVAGGNAPGSGKGQGTGSPFSVGNPTKSSTITSHGKYVTVYVPGVHGRGAHAFQLGPTGAVRQGTIIPYQQVFVRYEQTAHSALERSPLPPDLQAYVHRYFWAISR